MNNTLTALSGVRVGHSTHAEQLTGCTVIMFDKLLPVSYSCYGGAPGTFNTDGLRSGMTNYGRHGLFISGGSYMGLGSAASIMEAMTEENPDVNPVLSGATIFDLSVGLEKFNSQYGQEAYHDLSTNPVSSGNIGAGMGATVGKFQYLERGTVHGGMKAGLGNARVDLGSGLTICALSVVNAVGNVILPDGSILAGNRDETKRFKNFKDTALFATKETTNTTISVVGINVDLGTHENYATAAHYASNGQVRAINPVHTSIDGDTVFVFSTNEISQPLNKDGKTFVGAAWPRFSVDVIGNSIAQAVQESIYDACRSAETVRLKNSYQGVIPSIKDY